MIVPGAKYQKGEIVPLRVAQVSPKKDASGNHKFTVRQESGRKYYWIITFENEYSAEFTTPEATQTIFKVGKSYDIKIIDVNGYGATIELAYPVTENVTTESNVGAPLYRTMSGHPAVFAFGFAKDLAPHFGWSEGELFNKADDILDWLRTKQNTNA